LDVIDHIGTRWRRVDEIVQIAALRRTLPASVSYSGTLIHRSTGQLSGLAQ
jgi:hypothetical protein